MPVQTRIIYIGKDRFGYVYLKEYRSDFVRKVFVYLKAKSRASLRYFGELSENMLRLFSAKIRQALQLYLPARSEQKNSKMALLEFFETLDALLRNSPIVQKLIAEWQRIQKKYGLKGTPYEVLEQLMI